MKNRECFNSGRRQFLTRTVPACAVSCFAAGNILELINPSGLLMAQAKHKFDEKVTREMTYRQISDLMIRGYLDLSKVLFEELGKGKTIDIFKIAADKRGSEMGKRMAKRLSDNSFKTFKGIFKDEKRWKNSMTHSIIEDTDKVFEMKVTECIWADVFKAKNAGETGFAMICFSDYITAASFNPEMKMVRDKTLMQGHNCCNHRYLYSG